MTQINLKKPQFDGYDDDDVERIVHAYDSDGDGVEVTDSSATRIDVMYRAKGGPVLRMDYFRRDTPKPLNKKNVDDQPRDESGKWTSGGGGGSTTLADSNITPEKLSYGEEDQLYADLDTETLSDPSMAEQAHGTILAATPKQKLPEQASIDETAGATIESPHAPTTNLSDELKASTQSQLDEHKDTLEAKSQTLAHAKKQLDEAKAVAQALPQLSAAHDKVTQMQQAYDKAAQDVASEKYTIATLESQLKIINAGASKPAEEKPSEHEKKVNEAKAEASSAKAAYEASVDKKNEVSAKYKELKAAAKAGTLSQDDYKTAAAATKAQYEEHSSAADQSKKAMQAAEKKIEALTGVPAGAKPNAQSDIGVKPEVVTASVDPATGGIIQPPGTKMSVEEWNSKVITGELSVYDQRPIGGTIPHTLNEKQIVNSTKHVKEADLTAAQKSAITHYTGSGYMYINTAAREATPNSQVTAINEALKKAPPFKAPITVYRGVGSTTSSKFAQALVKAAKTSVGKTIVLGGFQSTTQMCSTGFTSKPILLEIRTAKGLAIKSLSKHSVENEVLLGHNWEYRIDGVETRTANYKKQTVIRLTTLKENYNMKEKDPLVAGKTTLVKTARDDRFDQPAESCVIEGTPEWDVFDAHRKAVAAKEQE